MRMTHAVPIHAIEVAFESIDVSGPEAAELGQPGIDLLKWFWLQAVETALCIHRGLHETGIAQHAQVLGHGRLRHTQPALNLSHRLLGRDQEAQYRAAVRLSNDFEDRFHSSCIPTIAYTCQGIYVRRGVQRSWFLRNQLGGPLGGRGGMKKRERRENFVQRQDCPTQAKIGLE